MAIPEQTIQLIKDTAKIEEVVGDYVSLRRRGANLIGLCPFHSEKTPSFNVNPARGIYKCFGCGKSGYSIKFVMEIEQCTYIEAVRQLAKKYHITIEEREQTEEEKQLQSDQESMTRVNEYCLKFFQDQLWNTEEGRVAGQGYLMQKRQIREDIIRQFQLGYSPEKSILCTELKKAGFDERFYVNNPEQTPVVGTGVVCRSAQDNRLFDRFHGRVMFPFFSPSGKVIGFVGRIIKQNDKVGKYVNSPASILFDKSNTLYGFYQAKNSIAREGGCILVEGQLDVISMVQSGVTNVVSSGGTSLTQSQIRLIRRFTPNLTIIYDGDKAGVKAALRGIDMVLAQGMNVKIVLLPEGQDPDEFARAHTSEETKEYIKQNSVDFIRFKTELLSGEMGSDPQKQAELTLDILHSIAVIPEIITREAYIKATAQMLRYDERMLRQRVQDLRRTAKAKEDSEMRQEQRKAEEQEKKQEEETPKRKPTILDYNYLNLIQLIIRYGEQGLYALPEGGTISVGDYVIQQLAEISTTTGNEVYDRMLEEFKQHSHEEGFQAERFYKFHSDPAINDIAIHMLTDQYIEASEVIDKNHLPETVEKMLNELRLTKVRQLLEENDQAMRQAQDEQRKRELMSNRIQLQRYQQQVCKLLGNRTTI